MKKLNFVSLGGGGILASLAVAVSLCGVANADIFIFGDLKSTSGDGSWKVSYLGGQSSQNGTVYTNNENDSVWAAGIENRYNGAYSEGYHTAVAGPTTFKDWDWVESGNWITHPMNVSGITNGELGRGWTGFYSYVTTISDENIPTDFRFNSLFLEFASDDHLQAIIVNGVLVDAVAGIPQDERYEGWKAGLVAIKLENISWNDEGPNTIEFIVHNNNSSQTKNFKNEYNPTGFIATIFASYWDGTDYDRIPDTEFNQGNPTPEPATLLILGLGAVGAGFAARRRMPK